MRNFGAVIYIYTLIGGAAGSATGCGDIAALSVPRGIGGKNFRVGCS